MMVYSILGLPFIDEPLAFDLSTILKAVPAAFFGDIDIVLAVVTSNDLAEFAAESVTLAEHSFNLGVKIGLFDYRHCGEVVHIRPSLQAQPPWNRAQRGWFRVVE